MNEKLKEKKLNQGRNFKEIFLTKKNLEKKCKNK